MKKLILILYCLIITTGFIVIDRIYDPTELPYLGSYELTGDDYKTWMKRLRLKSSHDDKKPFYEKKNIEGHTFIYYSGDAGFSKDISVTSLRVLTTLNSGKLMVSRCEIFELKKTPGFPRNLWKNTDPRIYTQGVTYLGLNQEQYTEKTDLLKRLESYYCLSEKCK